MMAEHKLGKCPDCQSENVVMMITMTLLMPAKYEHGIRKKNLTEATTELWGVNWPNIYKHCRDCGWQFIPLYEYGYNIMRAKVAEQYLRTLLKAFETDNLPYTEGTFKSIKEFLKQEEVHYHDSTTQRMDIYERLHKDEDA